MARHCGKCGKAGHYRSTCSKKSLKKQAKAAKKALKKSKKVRHTSGSVTTTRQGYGPIGKGRGWIAMYHGGRTGATQHDKTWSIKVVKKNGKCQVITRHGRRKGSQKETKRPLQSCAAAMAAAERLISSKFRKGYMMVGAFKRRRKTR